ARARTPSVAYGTSSRIRPRSRKPTAAYTALGHLRRLQARRLTSARERVVQVEGGQCGAQSAPPGTLQRCDVVDPAIAAEGERHRGRDVLATEACDQDVEGGVIGTTEEARRHPDDAQVLEPVQWPEFDLRPGQADVVERHAHRARRLVERVATPFEIAAHRLVALVHPGSKARDAGRRV